MNELLQEYWLLVLVALAIGVVVAWWIFHASRRTRVEREETPEGDAGAKRNQALIDAPPASTGAAFAAPAPGESNPAEIEAEPVEPVARAETVAEPEIPVEADAAASSPSPEAAAASGDDLTRIKGLGPKIVAILAEQGITRFAQIAAWDDADIDRIDATLGRFEGRIRRDNWIEQAQLLAADDIPGYEARFGKL